MKITKSQLKRIVKEEIQSVLNEENSIFDALGPDSQNIMLDWANSQAGTTEAGLRFSRVQVLDPPEVRPDQALELRFQFLP